jgi:SOS-response transcriptional repressor LexA
MKDWRPIFRRHMKKQGITQNFLAKQLNLTRGAIGHYLTKRREPELELLEKMAILVGLPLENLLFDEPPCDKPHNVLHPSNPPDMIRVPLLPWAMLAKWGKRYIDYMDKESVQMITLPRFAGSDAFAMIVESDSMVSSSGGMSFSPGMIIGVSPSTSYTQNDFVIAKHNTEEKCIFRQYVLDGGVAYLKPLNTQYKMEEMKDYEVVGVVGMSANIFKSMS